MRQVTHALLTRPPLAPKGSFDLHVLSTPPAFILSQDQTLRCIIELILFCFSQNTSLVPYYLSFLCIAILVKELFFVANFSFLFL